VTPGFLFQSGVLKVVDELTTFAGLAAETVHAPPDRRTRLVRGLLHADSGELRVEFLPDQPFDDAQEAAEVALRAWAEDHGEKLRFPDRVVADYDCPICGPAVVDWVCAWRGIGGSCGYITCPICADGSGGFNGRDRPTCPHYAATWLEEEGWAVGPLLDEREGQTLQPREITRIYERLVEQQGGHLLESLMDSGLMSSFQILARLRGRPGSWRQLEAVHTCACSRVRTVRPRRSDGVRNWSLLRAERRRRPVLSLRRPLRAVARGQAVPAACPGGAARARAGTPFRRQPPPEALPVILYELIGKRAPLAGNLRAAQAAVPMKRRTKAQR
jgi:hypothetical protein